MKSQASPTPLQVLQDRKNAVIRRGNWRRLIIGAACSALLVLAVFSELFGIAVVRGNSMEPSFRDKDLVLYTRIGSCRAGDIVIFLPPEEMKRDKSNEHIKRVIAMPGDSVVIDMLGNVSVNGQFLKEPYAAGFTGPRDEVAYPLQLKEKEHFVLGDSRENSRDSRHEGPIPANRISGRVIMTVRTRNGTAAEGP